MTIVYALIFFVPEGAPTDKPRDGGFSAPVDLATGTIGLARGRVGKETLTLVERAARAFSMLPALGWDIAVTPDGPVLLETNWQFGTTVTMVRSRRGEPSMLDTMFAQLAEPRLPDSSANHAVCAADSLNLRGA